MHSFPIKLRYALGKLAGAFVSLSPLPAFSDSAAALRVRSTARTAPHFTLEKTDARRKKIAELAQMPHFFRLAIGLFVNVNLL
jgi:hypothetical protein